MTAEELRKSILQQAVMGKLVPQNSNDESASVLLEKIKTEKDRLIQDGTIKKERMLPPITEEEIPFDIPDNWHWVRLNDISTYIQRGKSPKYSAIPKIPVISQKCIQWEGFNLSVSKFIDPDTLIKYEKIRYIMNDDILWNSTGTGTVGRANIFTDLERKDYKHIVADSHVSVVRTSRYINSRFITYYIASPIIQFSMDKLTSGSTKQRELNTSTIKSLLVPIPPLHEQNRIVEKIERLMKEIDEYGKIEEKLTSLNNKFPDDMRKSILQYAVQGKLTEQRKEDGDARDLLNIIMEEKKQLIKEGKIKKEKALAPITMDEIPFNIPDNWEWVRLNDISTYIQRGKSPKYSAIPKIPVISQKCIQWEGFNLSVSKFIDPDTLIKYEKIRYIMNDDILWNSTGTGTVGRANIFTDLERKDYKHIVADSHVSVVRTSRYINSRFITYYIASPIIQFSMDKLTSGSTKQRELNTSTIKSLLVPIPPLHEQNRIVSRLEQILGIIREATETITNITT
ncbi:restriction endonuclease subunit S [Sporolactobacillus sp. KGMB 08714]|uniref:restriction endonuclease subunit S n=1 Tax=Sporolactobacillus sp. KGMB 08714 TaxID=3064704 RepID=UPI002FBF1DA0